MSNPTAETLEALHLGSGNARAALLSWHAGISSGTLLDQLWEL